MSTNMQTMQTQAGGRFLTRFLPIAGLGLLGIIIAAPQLMEVARNLVKTLPAELNVSVTQLAAGQFIQLTVMTLVAAAMGSFFAPRVGFKSHVAGGRAVGGPFRSELPTAALVGVVAGVTILTLDAAFRPFMPPIKEGATLAQPRGVLITLAGMAYGGITEEILMRFGLMSLLVWAGWRLVQRGRPAPGAAVVWAGIAVTSLLFGVLHLGAAATVWDLTPLVVVRTVVINASGGVLFGWLYWRRSLEAAMVAHAGAHVVMTVLQPVMA